MKLYIYTILIIPFFTIGQNPIQKADKCFTEGNYDCAIEHYKEARQNIDIYENMSNEVIETKIEIASKCQEFAKKADEYFEFGNYSNSKSYYEQILNLNKNNFYAQSKIEECNSYLHPNSSLLLSKTEFSFQRNGGQNRVQVKTNAEDYNIIGESKWVKISKQKDFFILKCKPNGSDEDRSVVLQIKTDSLNAYIQIKQTGKKHTETIDKAALKNIDLKVKPSKIKFKDIGGTQKISVTTNAKSYELEDLPYWFITDKKDDGVSLSVRYNNDAKRVGYLTINAEGKIKNVKVIQDKGGRFDTDDLLEQCFNCPKTKEHFGVNLAYINKKIDLMEGVQIGFRYEPLFKYGFALNTGLNIETYSTGFSGIFNPQSDARQFALNVPVHFQYHFNFSKWFSMYAYIGGGYNIISNEFKDYEMPFTFEYGGGIKVNMMKISFGRSNFWGNFKDVKTIESNAFGSVFYNDFVISISLMF